MPCYKSLSGKRVEITYRAGVIQSTACGTLVSDTGRSVYVEERFTQRGKEKTLRVEIPYACVVRIAEVAAESATALENEASSSKAVNSVPQTKS
jgi:hypothetical protein